MKRNLMRADSARPQADAHAIAPAPEEDGKQLALAFQGGDEGAYQIIYDRYLGRVHSVCRRMLGDHHDAEEASQEAFLRVYQALPRFNGRYQLGAWIARITTNVCLDVIRTRTRRPAETTSLDKLEAEILLSEHDIDGDPETICIRRAESRRVQRVLASLPPLHRAAIVLRDFEGLSYEEIGIALDLSEGQVKALLHRARKGFRRSWPSKILSALVPARLLQRLRHDGTNPKEHTSGLANAGPQLSEVATSTAQVATSCSGVLQQCGQLVSERVAGFMAAAVVGTAVGAAAASSVSSPPPAVIVEDTAGNHSAESNERDARSANARTRAESEKHAKPSGGHAADEGTSSSSGAPTATPTPAPSPTPSPSPSGASGAGGAKPTPSPPPEPTGFSFGFSVDQPAEQQCSCLKATSVESESVFVDESGLRSYEQSLEGTAYAGGKPSYGLRLDHSTSWGPDHRVGFSLRTAEGGYFYSATGQLVERQKTEWGGWRYVYSGSYDIYSRPSTRERVPERGTYVAEVVVSWRQGRIVATTFSLTEDG